jgi:hypothetical protein
VRDLTGEFFNNIGSMLILGTTATAMDLTEAQMEDLVRQSYRRVAMYNVNNNFVLDDKNPMATGDWNRVKANTALRHHTMQAIARPNKDTLYIGAAIDVTAGPVVLELPAFDTIYASLMVTGYDHYVNVPLSTQNGDFAEPTNVLFYSERTLGYDGEPVDGVDKVFEATGDYLSAVIRIMPHANEPDRLKANLEAMEQVRVAPLSEVQGTKVPESKKPIFPKFGQTDFYVFENNLLEVIQFVFNHTTFDPNDPIDEAVLALYEPLGVASGRVFDADQVARLDGKATRAFAERVSKTELARATDPDFQLNMLKLFKPKGEMSLELLTFQSILGPIGLPATEAVYPAIATADRQPMSAAHDYRIHMSAEEFPPAKAFWSITLYDTQNGFFIPNDRKKYSVGLNGGMALDDDGGITIAIAAEKPDGVPEDNWLPIERGEYGIGPTMRIYAPDLEKFESWKPPIAQRME